jgi:hypothetical protein
MKNSIQTLLWELTWKNRVVFPVLAFLLVVSGILSFALGQAQPNVWWRNLAINVMLMSFAVSIGLGYALFSLMENHHGWRMNSMITRWFVLPVSTTVLVLLPFMSAIVFMTALAGLWVWLLGRLAEGFDFVYFLLTLVLGVVVMQALAWTVPRRPGQFWTCFLVIVVTSIFMGVAPQEHRDWAFRRSHWIRNMAIAIPVLALYAWYAAKRLRCGDWAGELPFGMIGRAFAWRSTRKRDFASATGALFWSDALPSLRNFSLSWLAVALGILGYVLMVFHRFRPEAGLSPKMLAFVAIDMLPLFGMFWLAVFGLLVGCEPAMGFRTRMSFYRSTLPLSAGQLAGHRIATLVIAWLMLWLPLMAFAPWYSAEFRGVTGPNPETTVMVDFAWRMALSAQLVAGALPIFLLGRLEGFPNLLLASISAWAVTWLMTGAFKPDPSHPVQNPVAFISLMLVLKAACTSWALWRGQRQGHISWRFAVGLIAGWAITVSVLVWVFPSWRTEGYYRALLIALMIPLARLALCPLAVAANRHR